MERRAEKRKLVDTLEITEVVNNDNMKTLFSGGCILNTSLTGFLISVEREDILDQELRGMLSLDSLVRQSISLYIPGMELELEGTVRLTRHKGKGQFEILLNFSADTPTYWRECLMDLLPAPGEFIR